MTRYRFNVCDLNAIETRVGAWLAGCDSLLNVFQPFTDELTGKHYPNGKDPYLDFAAKMYGIPYAKLWADYKGYNGEDAQIEAKKKRTTAKPGVLGAIYRLSGGEWIVVKGDRVRGGMWGYAHNMGVDMDQTQAHFVVRMFREAYPEICSNETDNVGQPIGIWKRLESVCKEVVAAQQTRRTIGPNGCVLIDKVNIAGRLGGLMRMQLPSGRRLHYLDARIESTEMPWEDRETGEKAWQDALCYNGQNQKTGMWSKIPTHGGKLFENLVQGIARDVLAVKLLEFEAADMPVVGHVHDEGICLVPDDHFSPGVEKMVEIMSRPIDWAPGLLLGADGFMDAYYHK